MDISSVVFVVCCACSGLSDKLIARSEESYSVCVFLCSRNHYIVAAYARVGCFATEGGGEEEGGGGGGGGGGEEEEEEEEEEV